MWDVQKAVQYLNQHAEPSSKGYCARYVKKAISAGGDISDWPSIVSAKDYGSALLARGFQVISGQNDFIAGDVVIIQGFNKSDFPAGEIKKDHPHGHMAMFNGQQWVSDFKQNNGYYPGGDYRKAKPGFVFYRHKDVGSHSSETKAASGTHSMKICFPVRKKNGQDYATLDEMMQLVNAEPHGTWLAGTNLLWHGGIHLSEASAKWSILEPGKADAAVPVQCMVGGEIVAWRVNQDYLTNIYADHTLQYSSTFVLVKSTCQPDPKNEKSWLDFYTLYMGLAPLCAFEKHKCMKVKAESGIRRHPHGQYEGSQSSPTMTMSYKGTWKKGTRVLVLKEQTFTYRHKENQVFGLAQEIDARGVVKGKSYWVSTSTDFMEPDGEEYAHLPDWMKQAVEQGGFDSVVKPSSPLSIAAGDAIGFLGKDTDSTGAADAETSHFVHIEVLSADPRMPDFLNNTAQVKAGRKYIRLHEDGKLYTRSGDTFTENSGELGKDIHRVLPEDQCNPFTDVEKKRWFQVSPQSWMSQDGVDELPQYSLKELGFTTLEQSATSDMAASLCEDWAKQALGEIAKQIVPARGLQEKQVADYYQKAMKRIDTDGNGKLTAQELHAAFTHPEMDVCDIVARMVVKHDSEWFGNSSDPKWAEYYKDYDKPLLNYSKKWQDDMSWMESVEPFNKGEPVWHMHPVMFLDALKQNKCDCESLYADKFKVTRYGHQYGPIYKGSMSLDKYPRWKELLDSGEITENEKSILIAMSQNEGNMDAVQSYDSEVITAGAMQKTVKDSSGLEGKGELSAQLASFRDAHADLYYNYAVSCGWTVEGSGSASVLYYCDQLLTEGKKITATKLKTLIRNNCNENTYGKVIHNKPLAALVKIITLPEYLDLQVIDFVKRLHKAESSSVGNGRKIKDYAKSNFGRALVLDESVNRPGNVASDFKKAIKNLHDHNPEIDRDPEAWGSQHSSYESKLLDEYRLTRRMTDSTLRYNALKAKL